MRFDLPDLRLFVAVARSGSITGGAAHLNLALASASQRLAGMEAVLGTPLLVRSRRGVIPTEAGRALLRHAQDILDRTERMHGELQSFAKGSRGTVRLLSNTGALLGFLPHALQGFLVDHPGLDIEIAEHSSAEVVQAVAEGRAELGVISDAADPGGLCLHFLGRHGLAVLTAREHPLAGQGQVSFADLLDQPFVGLLDAALERYLADHAARHGAFLSYRIRLRSVASVARMVESGIGVAILPESVQPELDGLGVALTPINDAWARRRLGVCLRSVEGLSRPARLLFEHLRAIEPEPES